MPVPSGRSIPSARIRRRLERLEALPLRPTTARLLLGGSSDGVGLPPPEFLSSSRFRTAAETDPGWVLAHARIGSAPRPLAVVENSAWWARRSGPASDALQRLWRHAVAVAQAAHRLARERGAAESVVNRVAHAGLLHSLGGWALAAIEPEWLVEWFALGDRHARLALEVRDLGTELSSLGRYLAESWGCDPLVADAAWLHADGDGQLNAGAVDGPGLALVQQAFMLAEKTPWSLSGGDGRIGGTVDPRIRLLIAEVQVRCGAPFIEADATTHEETLSRSNARLRLELARLHAEKAAADSLVDALGESTAVDSPRIWAERAARSWCQVPGVATARVVWTGPAHDAVLEPELEPDANPARAERPPSEVIELSDRCGGFARIQLWDDPDRDSGTELGVAMRPAWNAWGALVAERARLEQRLEALVRGHRDRAEQEEPRLRRAKLDALAEFAAGAGHELNNPLAVIVGRAQLLLARTSDPDAARSLRAILAQGQRTHRILRDLMFVARTPEPRPRFCQPDEVVRACLRDVKAEADVRGIGIVLKGSEPGPRVWADPDALRHLADVLVRNALESTPEGGTIQFAASGGPREVAWTVTDSGRGISPDEAEHVFDLFYCGRQAGRGLGLGLPRAARIVEQAGGALRWQASPGQGTIFHVHIPLASPPTPPSTTNDGPPPGLRNESPQIKS